MKIHVHPKSPLLLGVFTVTSNLLPGEPNLLVEHGGEDHLDVLDKRIAEIVANYFLISSITNPVKSLAPLSFMWGASLKRVESANLAS